MKVVLKDESGIFIDETGIEPYVAVAAASLSQAIHQTEGGLALTAVPTPQEEASRPFQWDSHRRL